SPMGPPPFNAQRPQLLCAGMVRLEPGPALGPWRRRRLAARQRGGRRGERVAPQPPTGHGPFCGHGRTLGSPCWGPRDPNSGIPESPVTAGACTLPAAALDRPRITLITEFFPATPQAVFGAFQRLQRHLEALAEVGNVDVIFLWPEGRRLSEPEVRDWAARARSAMDIKGNVGFVPVALRNRWIDHLLDFYWASRGAIGFFRQGPTMRTSGRKQAKELRRLLALARPDLIFAHRMGSGAALLRAGIRGPIILDVDDVEHV